jgi:peptidoglycan/xylan/chitin deacetylase (PgdA/CDA1 family)
LNRVGKGPFGNPLGSTSAEVCAAAESRESVAYPNWFDSGPRESNKIALTIDDFWSASNANRALDIAETFAIPLTIFPIGRAIQYSKGLQAFLRRALCSQVQVLIGYHTQTHPFLTRLSNAQIDWEIAHNRRSLDDALGFPYPVQLVRPPYGDGGYRGRVNGRILAKFNEMGLSETMWSINFNSNRSYITKPKIVRGGDIILMHTTNRDIRTHMQGIVDELKNGRGSEFVTVAELFATHNST